MDKDVLPDVNLLFHDISIYFSDSPSWILLKKYSDSKKARNGPVEAFSKHLCWATSRHYATFYDLDLLSCRVNQATAGGRESQHFYKILQELRIVTEAL